MRTVLLICALTTLAGCAAATRPDPSKYLTPTGHVLEASPGMPAGASYVLDDKAYGKALAESQRHDWTCLLADWGTTAVGLGIGLAESNPLGAVGAVAWGAIFHKAVVEPHRAQGDDFPQNVENVVHCGAAAWNVAVIAGAL